MLATLISPDEIKKELPGYTPERSGEFHVESAKLADQRFDEALKTANHPKVILLSGGPASGKTEYMSEYLMGEDVVIYDGILPREEGAKIKLSHIRKSGKTVEVHAVWPATFKQAYAAFLERDRKFDDSYFYAKHSSARQTLLWLALEHPEVTIRLFRNSYTAGDLSFTELQFETREAFIAFLKENQYAQEDILAEISK